LGARKGLESSRPFAPPLGEAKLGRLRPYAPASAAPPAMKSSTQPAPSGWARLRGVDEVLIGECADVAAYYKLIDRLRRILPLGWQDTKLTRQLEETAPELVALVREHASEFCAQVLVRSRWSGDELLTKRVYGDGVRPESSDENRVGVAARAQGARVLR
jgi:hypothetical protein